MKLSILISLLVSATAFAGEPASSSSFTVTRDGKTKTYLDDEYVVVKRRKGPKPTLKPAPQACTPMPTSAPIVAEKPARKNTVKLYAGVGPAGYGMEIKSSALHISQGYEAVLGLGYSRKFGDRWSLEGVGVTNGTALLGVGWDF